MCHFFDIHSRGTRLLSVSLTRHGMRIGASTPKGNLKSLCLCTKLGLRPREPLSVTSGTFTPNSKVRGETGHQRGRHGEQSAVPPGAWLNRGGELREAIDAKTARVVEQNGSDHRYASEVAFFAHAVAETSKASR